MAKSQFLSRSALVVLGTLVVMIIPFLTLEAHITRTWHAWQATESQGGVRALWVVGLLAADIALPVPSSVVATYAGSRWGAWRATPMIWSGLTLGAISGYVVGRWGGRAAMRLCGTPHEIEQIRAWQQLWGIPLLVLARGIPLLAEATVVLAGVHGLAWTPFLAAMACSNLGLAVAYAFFGEWAERTAWLPGALAVSAALPLLLAVAAKIFLQRRRASTDAGNQTPDGSSS